MITILYILIVLASLAMVYFLTECVKHFYSECIKHRELINKLEIGDHVFVKCNNSVKMVQVTSIGTDHIQAIDIDTKIANYRFNDVLLMG